MIPRALDRPALLSLVLVLALALLATRLPGSELKILGRRATPGTSALLVRLRESGPGSVTRSLAARVVVKHEALGALDGSGRGLYSDGRFYAEGSFRIECDPGKVRLEISAGPERDPLAQDLELRAGEELEVEVTISRWIDLASLGLFPGDAHVHSKHDATGEVRSDLASTALQARAEGLAWISEADADGPSPDPAHSSDSFLFLRAREIRPGGFSGHHLSAATRSAIPWSREAAIALEPLPIAALARETRGLGGASIHTHPTTPPQLHHWMGATEALLDAVTGTTTDLFDIESRASEEIYFSLLEADARLGVSGSSDAALVRRGARAPGARRVHVRAQALERERLAGAMRRQATFATNGGPLFALLDLDGVRPGESWPRGDSQASTPGLVTLAVASRYPLRSVEIIERGRTIASPELVPREGSPFAYASFQLPPGVRSARSWILARVEDTAGHWAITSPIWLLAQDTDESPAVEEKSAVTSSTPRSPRRASVLAISNATRFIELRREFFAHAIVAVEPEERLGRVELLRDGRPVRTRSPGGGDQRGELPPVTGLPVPHEGRVEFEEGWLWHPDATRAHLFQADWPLVETGWYSLRYTLASGLSFLSDAIWFDRDHPLSHSISSASLAGPGFELRWRGHGEEMALDEIKLPFAGDHWWYPRSPWWEIESRLKGEPRRLSGGSFVAAASLFRATEGPAPARTPSAPLNLLRSSPGRPFSEELSPWIHESGPRDPRGVFRLESGQLRISGERPGYLGTRSDWRDYRLVVEWRWGERNHGARIEKARDAGIFLHARGPDGNSFDGAGAFRASLEVQIMEGAVGDLVLLRGFDRRTSDPDREPLPGAEITASVASALDPDGWPSWDPAGEPRTIRNWGRLNRAGKSPRWRDVLGEKDPSGLEKAKGWNQLEITAREDVVEVRLNGVLVNRARGVTPGEGAVCLQSEGSELVVRRFELLPLPE